MKLKSLPWEETVKISRDWAVSAITTLAKLPREQASKPLRFIYMSGHFAPRERTEQIKVLGDNNMMEYGFLRVSGVPMPPVQGGELELGRPLSSVATSLTNAFTLPTS